MLEAEINARTVDVRWNGETDSTIPLAHLALLGMSLSSDVAAGENRGRNLQHEIVVLGIKTNP